MSGLVAKFEEIVETFELLDNWEERYRYLIGLGRKLETLSEEERCQQNIVRGCQSQVWLIPEISDEGRFRFRGESDASIVSGLIAVILALHWDRTAAEILEIDVEKEMSQLHLENHLTASRRNGLFSMAQKIRSWAEEYQG